MLRQLAASSSFVGREFIPPTAPAADEEPGSPLPPWTTGSYFSWPGFLPQVSQTSTLSSNHDLQNLPSDRMVLAASVVFSIGRRIAQTSGGMCCCAVTLLIILVASWVDDLPQDGVFVLLLLRVCFQFHIRACNGWSFWADGLSSISSGRRSTFESLRVVPDADDKCLLLYTLSRQLTYHGVG